MPFQQAGSLGLFASSSCALTPQRQAGNMSEGSCRGQGTGNEVGIVAPRKAKAELQEAVSRQPFVHFLDTLIFLKNKTN